MDTLNDVREFLQNETPYIWEVYREKHMHVRTNNMLENGLMYSY